jgi:hypothetical protein
MGIEATQLSQPSVDFTVRDSIEVTFLGLTFASAVAIRNYTNTIESFCFPFAIGMLGAMALKILAKNLNDDFIMPGAIAGIALGSSVTVETHPGVTLKVHPLVTMTWVAISGASGALVGRAITNLTEKSK